MAKRSTTTVGIALLGLGTVGGAVYNLIERRRKELADRFGVRLEVRRALVRNPEKTRKVDIPFKALTTSYDDILEDESIDIVVEVMGGLNPAFNNVTAALKARRPVVTANKHLLAERGEEIEAIAIKKKVPFRFEASVGGIIPIIAALNNGLNALDIVKVRGILNGTANFILSSMRFDGISYDEALHIAQEKGYAEPDPSLDISGQDTAHKLCVLSRLVCGRFLPLKDVAVSGIGPETKVTVDGARHMGQNVKLVGTLVLEGKGSPAAPEGKVALEVLVKEDPMFGINGPMNCISIETKETGAITLSGRGAGGPETATSVVSDILAIARSF